MGAAQSGAGGGRAAGGGGDGSDGRPRDHYDVLGLEPTATTDDVRKAYRRLALRFHPDKNPDDVEAAQQQFLLVQAAYDVLNDEQERAWYDAHKDDILNGNLDEDVDDDTFEDYRSGKATPAAPSQTGPGLTIRHLDRLAASASTLETTGPKADESGFFGTFRRLFERLADEEKAAMRAKGVAFDADLFPSYGYSHTPFAVAKGAEANVHQVPVREFYKVWSNFVSEKSFVWMERYQTNQAPDRTIKRLMEKENKRLRDQARKEYNEAVRDLVAYIRKRDPRVKSHQDTQAAAASSQRARREAEAKQVAAERQRAAQEYVAQDWQRTETYIDSEFDTSESEEEEEGEGDERTAGAYVLDEDDEDADEHGPGPEPDAGPDQPDDEDGEEGENDAFECLACDKVFLTEGGLRNHEQSKKHKQKVEKLRREMREEDAALQLDPAEPEPEPAQVKARASAAAAPQQHPNGDVSQRGGADVGGAKTTPQKKGAKAGKKQKKGRGGRGPASDGEAENGREEAAVLADRLQRNLKVHTKQGEKDGAGEEGQDAAGQKDSAALAAEFVPPEGSFDVFGYGSLIFKPPPHVLHAIPGFVSGYVRRFAQSSNDHRGTPQRPGRVVTLVSAADWHASAPSPAGGDDPDAPPEGDIVWGVSYTIDPAHAKSVRAYLDHREKNGYSPHAVDVFALDASSSSSSSTTRVRVRENVLLYVGLPDNEAYVGPEPLDRLAERIVSCSGPSGPNYEYVLKLAEAVRELPDSRDTYLFALEQKVLVLLRRDGVLKPEEEGEAKQRAKGQVRKGNRALEKMAVDEEEDAGRGSKKQQRKRQQQKAGRK